MIGTIVGTKVGEMVVNAVNGKKPAINKEAIAEGLSAFSQTVRKGSNDLVIVSEDKYITGVTILETASLFADLAVMSMTKQPESKIYARTASHFESLSAKMHKIAEFAHNREIEGKKE